MRLEKEITPQITLLEIPKDAEFSDYFLAVSYEQYGQQWRVKVPLCYDTDLKKWDVIYPAQAQDKEFPKIRKKELDKISELIRQFEDMPF